MDRWNNGGGYVADTACVEDTVFVGPDCKVLDSAVVKGDTVLAEGSVVSGTACVVDSFICNSVVGDKAIVVGSNIRNKSVITQICSVWSSNVDGVRINRFSKVIKCELEGGVVQGDLLNEKLKDCRVL